MNIQILAVGKAKTAYLETAIQEYAKRLNRWTTIKWHFVATGTIEKESQQLLMAIPKDAVTILLDECGAVLTTPELAAKLEDWQNLGTRTIAFVIGGAYGVNNELKKQADIVWSLSALTFPHQLVRLILVEQLYRAHDLNHGGKYHHA